MYNLENKIALVTGASRGIGRAIAQKLVLNGACVVINYANSEEEAQSTLNSLENKKNSFALKFDVSKEEEVLQAISTIKEKLGTIDILVNNAGITIDALLMRLKISDYEKQMDINLKGAFICSQAVIRDMIKNKSGKIINLSSVAGEMGNVGQCAYAASKAGLIGFTKSLAKEVASKNVTVNAVSPGYIETDMTKNILGKAMEQIVQAIPLNRIGKACDIANAVAFLASSEADYVTGQVLSVNGGLYI